MTRAAKNIRGALWKKDHEIEKQKTYRLKTAQIPDRFTTGKKGL